MSLRKFLVRPICSGAQLAEFVLTTLGILVLIVGLWIIPSLALDEAGFYLGLLALVAFMLLCFCAGQLVLICERLPPRGRP